MDEKRPECCGAPVEIFQMRKGEWVCHCINCWEGTMPQQNKEEAIEAWYAECEGGDVSGKA